MKKVSLVLSGGGARGIAHIGVIEELEKQGYEIHSISGTSMGAVVGGIYAAGKLEEFKEWVLKSHKLDILKLLDFTFLNNGLIKGDKLFKELKKFIAEQQIEQLPINFAASATDLISRKEVIFTEGSLYNAIRASMAIPNIFTAVKNNDSVLVDGGVLNNLPINNALRKKNDLLIAVNVNANIPLVNNQPKVVENSSYYQKIKNEIMSHFHTSNLNNEHQSLSYFDIMNDSFEIMRDELVKFTIEKYPPDILIEIPRHICNIYDFYKAQELILAGQQALIKKIEK